MSPQRTPATAYLMDGPREGPRLEAKTRTAASRRQLRRAGLAAGMDALDVGCGSGAVTRVMAAIVEPGRATGVDASAARIAQAQALAAERGVDASFVCTDATALDLPAAAFDFTWSRFLFEYLAEPERALAEMVRVTRPGGTVVVADLDGQLRTFHPMDAATARSLADVLGALEAAGFDPDVGRKLYGWFRSAGLADIRVHIEPHQCYAGGIPGRDRSNWRDKLATALPRLPLPDAARTAAAEALGALVERPDLFYYSTLVTVRGRVR